MLFFVYHFSVFYDFSYIFLEHNYNNEYFNLIKNEQIYRPGFHKLFYFNIFDNYPLAKLNEKNKLEKNRFVYIYLV